MIIEVIQFMLAPAIMINSCGLLLLGMNNKYSLVVNRIRLLNEERRKLVIQVGEREFNYGENIRFESIAKQLTKLVYRVKLVRNAVFSYTVAIALFILTSLLIGFKSMIYTPGIDSTIIGFFLAGMVSVLVGVFFAAFETLKGYDIIQLEVSFDE